MVKVQKVYTRDFKEEAVRLAQTSGKPIAQIARELGISDSSIHQWRKELTGAWVRSVSRQWTSPPLRGGKSTTQTRTRKSPAGA